MHVDSDADWYHPPMEAFKFEPDIKGPDWLACGPGNSEPPRSGFFRKVSVGVNFLDIIVLFQDFDQLGDGGRGIAVDLHR